MRKTFQWLQWNGKVVTALDDAAIAPETHVQEFARPNVDEEVARICALAAAAGSLALSGALGGRSREQVRQALERVGHRADVRAERLSPEDFRALARALEL